MKKIEIKKEINEYGIGNCWILTINLKGAGLINQLIQLFSIVVEKVQKMV